MAFGFELDGDVRVVRDSKTGPSLYYSVTELTERNRSSRVVMAFRCHTEPPLFLEVRESEYQAYSVTIFVKKTDLVDESIRVHYIVKVVDDITEGKFKNNIVKSERRKRLFLFTFRSVHCS